MAMTSSNATYENHADDQSHDNKCRHHSCVAPEGGRVAWDRTGLTGASTLGAFRSEAKKSPVRLTGLSEASSRLGLRRGRRDRLSSRRVVLVVMLVMMLLGRGRAAGGHGGSGRSSRGSGRSRS